MTLPDFPCPTTPEACTNCGVSLADRRYIIKGNSESPYAIHCGMCDAQASDKGMLNIKIQRYIEFLENNEYRVYHKHGYEVKLSKK